MRACVRVRACASARVGEGDVWNACSEKDEIRSSFLSHPIFFNSPRNSILTPSKSTSGFDSPPPPPTPAPTPRLKRQPLQHTIFQVTGMTRPGERAPYLTYSRRLLVGWLLACNMLVYLRDGSAQSSERAATLRQKLQIKLSISPSHSILTPGQPVPELTLQRQAPGRVATGVAISKSLV